MPNLFIKRKRKKGNKQTNNENRITEPKKLIILQECKIWQKN